MGTDVDLFGRGVADLVIDEELTKELLDAPGNVIGRPRGTSDDHMTALLRDKPSAPQVSFEQGIASALGCGGGLPAQSTQ